MKIFFGFVIVFQIIYTAQILKLERGLENNEVNKEAKINDLKIEHTSNQDQGQQVQPQNETQNQTKEDQKVDENNSQLKTQNSPEEVVQNQITKDEKILDKNNDASIQVSEYEDSAVKINLCDLKFVSIFTKGQGQVIPDDGVQATKEITDLCPGLVVSCCSHEDIKINFDRVQTGLQAFENNYKNLEQFLQVINNVKEYEIEQFLQKHSKELNQCVKDGPDDEQPRRFRELIFEVQKLSNYYLRRYKQYIRKVFVSQYKLQCGICDISLQNHFLVTKHKGREFYNVIVKAPEQIQAYFDTMSDYSELYNIEILSYLFQCIVNKGQSKKLESLKYGQQNFKLIMKNYRPETVEDDENALSLFSQEGIPGGQIDTNYGVMIDLTNHLFHDQNTEKLDQDAWTFWVPLENKKGEKPFDQSSVQLSTHSEGYDETKIKLNYDGNHLQKLYEITHTEEGLKLVSVLLLMLIPQLFGFQLI